jgi:hypothetical protein
MTPPVRRRSLAEIFGGGASATQEPERYGPIAGAMMAAVDGATLGTATPVGAALSAGARKIGGDDRAFGDIYRSEADDLRGKLRDYRRENPATALGATVTGGVLSPLAKLLGGVRVAKGAGTLAKAANAGTQGALAGSVSNASTSERLDDVLGNAAMGGLVGFGAGSVFSLGADGIRQAGRAVGLGPRAANDPSLVGRARAAVGAETAEQSGARRTLRAMEREGLTLDELAARSRQADAPDILGEVIGTQGVRATRTARMAGNKAPGEIDDALLDRAMEETARLRATFERLTGARPQDAKEVADAAMARVEPLTRQLYQKVGTTPAGAEGSRRIADVVSDLDADGIGVWRLARKLGGLPDQVLDQQGLPAPMTIGQALKVRQALDAMMDDAQTSADRIIQGRIAQARGAIDEVVKSGGGDAASAQAVQLADEIFSNAKQIGQSFSGGVRAAQSGNAPTAARIFGEQAKPEMARAGVGSDILRRLGQVADEGSIQNAAPRVIGGDTKRQMARMAFPDDASFQEFREAGNNAARRLATRNTVSGGSQTMDKMVDALEFATDPSVYSQAATNPLGLMQRLGESGVARRLVDANASEADAMAKYLMAGAPGQMTREQAIEILQRMEPFMRSRLAGQANRAGVGAVVGGRSLANP